MSIVNILSDYFSEFLWGIYFNKGDKSFVREMAGLEKNLSYIRYRNCQGDNIFVKPVSYNFFILIDDLKDISDRLDKPGRMIVETSPANFQVWIHSDRMLEPEEKHHYQKLYGTDPGANSDVRWGRCPGFTNRKDKYKRPDGSFPLSRIIKITSGNEPFPRVQLDKTSSKVFNIPFLESTRKDLKSWDDFYSSDYSSADMKFAIYLLGQGLSISETKYKLLNESFELQKRKCGHVDNYLDRTISKAFSFVQKTHNSNSNKPSNPNLSLID